MTQRLRFPVRPAVWLLLTALCLTTSAVSALEVKLPRIPSVPTVNVPVAPTPIAPPTRPLTPAEIWRQQEAESAPAEQAAKAAEAKQEEKEDLRTLIEKLLNEFGPDARYGITNHFIVIYDTTDSFAYWCATLLEKVVYTYARFVSFTSFVEDDYVDPMIVVIFARQEDYEAYIKKHMGSDFANKESQPVGVYSTGPNRSVFYDMTGEEKNKAAQEEKRRTVEEVAAEILACPDGEESLSVVVHEGTHQISHNFGLFARSGENPQWAVEGLAMLFETPSGEAKDAGWKVLDEKVKTITFPINKRRVREFQAYAQSTKDEQPVKKCVGLESIRGEEPCAYPVSWALFYYLYVNYPKQLGEYLANSAMMQPRLSYSSRERVYEFMEFFGDDWDGMYLELRAFVDGLELELNGVDHDEAQARARKTYDLPELPTAVKKSGRKSSRKTSETQKRERQKAADADSDEAADGADAVPEEPSAAEPSNKTEPAKKTEPSKKSEPAKKSESGRKAEPSKKTEPSKKSAAADGDDDDWLDAWEGEKTP